MEIYRITNLINDRMYIGKNSTNRSNYYGGGILIKQAIKKYGKENFKKEIIAECSTIEMLNEIEIFFIALYRKRFGNDMLYNIADGGSCARNGVKTSDETKEKLSRNANPWLKGKKLPKHICEQISKTLTGKTHSEETKKKMSISHKENKYNHGENNYLYRHDILDEDILILQYLGLSNRKIAEKIGCSHKTISKRVRKIRGAR